MGKYVNLPNKRTFIIIIDESHNERTARDNYQTFKAKFEDQGKVFLHSEKPLTASSLRGVNLLVIGGPESSWIFNRGGDKWGGIEVQAIERFVAGGGALFMLGDGLGSAEEMSLVTAPYGITFSGDLVDDVTISKDTITSHPITEDVDEICLGSDLNMGGRYMEVKKPAVVLAELEGQPVMAYCVYEKGRVVVMSSLSAFSQKYIEKNDVQTLLKNILEYLLGPHPVIDAPPVVKETKPQISKPVEKRPAEQELTPKILDSPICSNCGAELDSENIFCGNCGTSIQPKEISESKIAPPPQPPAEKQNEIKEPARSLRGEEFISNAPEMEELSRVLSWVLKTHSEALISLTGEIAPFLETGFKLDEEKRTYYFPTSMPPTEYVPATVDNLLLRTFFLSFPKSIMYDYWMGLDRVKEGIKVSVDEMRKIKEKTQDLFKAYASTRDALEAFVKASNPIAKGHFGFGVLQQKGQVTNVKKLRKFEKVVKDFLKEIRKQDWNRFPQVDPSIWKRKAEGHTTSLLTTELEYGLEQDPVLSWHPLNIHTDIERRLIPFFTAQERIDDSYLKCRTLLQKCKDSSGFLTGSPTELKNEAIEALKEFNVNYDGIYHFSSYAAVMIHLIKRDIEHGIRRIRPHKISLNDIDKYLANPLRDGSVKNADKIIQQIHYMVSWERNS